jgi:hypothetical protein
MDAAAAEIERSGELLEDGQSPAALERARRASEHLDQAADSLEKTKHDSAAQQQFAAYDATRAAATALAARQAALREETARLDAISRESGKLSRSQLRTLRQSTDDETALASDTETAAKESPDEIARWALTTAARSMRDVASRLEQRQTSVDVQGLQSQIEKQLHVIAESLVLDSPPPDAAPQPSPGEGSDSAEQNEPSEFVWLAPQLELLRRMQQDLIERTNQFQQQPADVEGRELQAQQLQSDQQKLAELATAILSVVSGEGEPPALQQDDLRSDP